MRGRWLEVVAVTMVLGVCGGVSSAHAQAASDALVQAARREGEVVWYTTLIVDQVVRPMAAAWAKAYPDIKLRFSRAQPADQAMKIVNEARAGRLQADVFDGSSTIYTLLDADLVQSFRPQAASDYPEEFRDKEGYWTALNAYYMVPAFNTAGLPADQAPKKWEDLLDPKFRGRLAWSTDASANGAPGFIGLMLAVMGEEKGAEFLTQLAQQKVANVPAAQRVVLDQVIAGEYQIGLMMFNHHAAISKAAGAPIEWIRMDPALATLNYLGMLRNARHPSAARLFIEFMLSEQGQAVIRDAGYIPAHPKVGPKDPSLRPDSGKFKYLVLPTDTIRRSLPQWLKLHREIFR